MKLSEKFVMKHSGMKARDLEFTADVDIDAKTITLGIDWIDSGLIDWTLKFALVSTINGQLESNGLPKLDLDDFQIELVVAGKARFSVRRVERDFDDESTLVMHFKG